MVCGIMLLFMTEEETFWMTAQVCEELLKDYYTPSILGAVVDQKVFEVLVGKFMPGILS